MSCGSATGLGTSMRSTQPPLTSHLCHKAQLPTTSFFKFKPISGATDQHRPQGRLRLLHAELDPPTHPAFLASMALPAGQRATSWSVWKHAARRLRLSWLSARCATIDSTPGARSKTWRHSAHIVGSGGHLQYTLPPSSIAWGMMRTSAVVSVLSSSTSFFSMFLE